MKKKTFSLHKGVVLVLVAAGIALMLIMTVAMASLGFQSRVIAIRTSQEILARTAADAGHDRALFQLNRMTSNWPADNDPSMTQNGILPGTNQSYTFVVTKPDIPPELSDYAPYVFNIESTGWSGTTSPKQRKVFSTVVLTRPYSYGIFVQDTVEIKNSGAVDSYDSSLGPYGAGNEGNGVLIGTNACGDGDIALRMDADIAQGSEIHVGPLDGPGAAESAYNVVTGQGYFPEDCIYSESIAAPVTTWTLPESTAGAGTLNVKQGEEYCLDCAGTYVYEGVRAGQGAKVTVQGPGEVVLTVGNGGFELNQGATLEIQVGASLILYLDGDFVAKQSSFIYNDGAQASMFVLRGTPNCQDVIIHNEGDFYGVIDAPYASLDIQNSGDVYGAVTAFDAVVRNTGGFHYDRMLSKTVPGDLGAKFVVVRWREE